MGVRSLRKEGGDLNREVSHNKCVWYKSDKKNVMVAELKPLQRGLGACLAAKFGFLH